MKRNQNTIFLRKYKNEDAYKVFLFFKKQNAYKEFSNFKKWHEYSKWAYWNNPYVKGKSPAMLGLKNSKIVWFSAKIFVPFRIKNKLEICPILDKMCKHKNLNNLISFKLIFNFWNDKKNNINLMTHHIKKSSDIWKNWKCFEIKNSNLTFRKILNIKSLILIKIQNLVNNNFNLKIKLLKKNYSKRIFLSKENFFQKYTKIEIDQLCKKYMANYNCNIIRDYNFLKWKYLNHSKSFKVLTYKNNNILIGFLILSFEKNGIIRIYEFIGYKLKKKLPEILKIIKDYSKGYIFLETKFINNQLIKSWFKEGFKVEKKNFDQFSFLYNKNYEKMNNLSTYFTFGDFK